MAALVETARQLRSFIGDEYNPNGAFKLTVTGSSKQFKHSYRPRCIFTDGETGVGPSSIPALRYIGMGYITDIIYKTAPYG
jgi:hypothetical protein